MDFGCICIFLIVSGRLNFLQHFYVCSHLLYACFALFRDRLESVEVTFMDGLYLGIVIVFFGLTGLLVKLFEKV